MAVSKSLKKLDDVGLISIKKDNSIQLKVYLSKEQPEELEWKNRADEDEELEDKYGENELQEKLNRYKEQKNKESNRGFSFDIDEKFPFDF